MSSQTTTRGTALAVAALLLGGALVVGATYSALRANAAPRLDLAVTAKASTVGKALGQANEAATKVQGSLRHNGVAPKDLQTSDLQVQPDYSYPSNGTPVLRGYTVTEGVAAKLRNLGKSGSIISDAVAAGGDAVRINGIQLDLSDSSTLVAAARDKAIADAKAKADQYARAAGRSLGQVVGITENVSEPSPVDYSVRAAAAPGNDVPIQPGSQEVGVQVTVVYAFR